ncbi:MAG: DegT/DnrJ/EryC1/StrS family aminotransferase [Candidatus Liptonbacteria bacterium]|nr:DegT/DnrJ/EryC1/StrS family aminotransferase [Candidatus Liptonbacteria bacterium]
MGVKVHLGSVNITEETKKLMREALDAGVISQGRYTEDFEAAIRKKFSAPYALSASSGTAADTLMLAAAKYLRPGKDEVIIPALTFIAHVNAAYYNHLKPVFVDVGPDFQIDTSKIEEKITPRTLAITPVNLLGGFCDMDAIADIARRRGIWFLSDDCEAFGSTYKGKYAGTLADAGTYSFFASHTICCGEGGMVVTKHKEMADLIVSLRNHAVKSHNVAEKFVFPRIGFNAKMNSMEAIIGLGLIGRLDEFIAKKKRNYAVLRDGLGVDLIPDTSDRSHVLHGFPLMFASQNQRDEALQKIFNAGIECRKLFSSIPTDEEAYRYLGYTPGAFPVAEDLSHRTLYLPIHQNLTDEDLAFMVHTVKPLLA